MQNRGQVDWFWNAKRDENAPFCKGCFYYDKTNKCCDYLIFTGIRRPCKAGEGCTVKLDKKHPSGIQKKGYYKKRGRKKHENQSEA